MSIKSPGNGGSIVQGTGGSIKQAFTDNSGTPGNTTINTPRGRFAVAAAAASLTVTCSACAATSTVLLALGGSDGTLTSIRSTPGAGGFTVLGNAAATGNTVCDFVVVN